MAARQVGHDAAALVVSGGGHRQPVACADPARPRRGPPRSSGSAGRSGRARWRPARRGPSPWSTIAARIARDTTSRGSSSSTKRSPAAVAQQRAVAAQRLGQQRARHARVVQRGRVELEELQVRHGDARPQRHRHPVARRHLAGWWSPRRAGRRRRWPTARGGTAPRGSAVGGHRPAPRCSGRRSRSGRGRRCARAAPPRCCGPPPTSARSISAPVAAPPACTTRGHRVPALTGELEVAPLVTVELRAERDQVLDPARALVDQHPHRVDVAQARARRERVGQVQVDLLGVARERGRDTTLRPPCRGQVETALGDDPGAQSVGAGGLDRRRQPGDTGARAPAGPARRAGSWSEQRQGPGVGHLVRPPRCR